MEQALKTAEIKSPIDLISLTESKIEKLTFKSGNKNHTLSLGNQSLIQLFNSYCRTELKKGMKLTEPGGFMNIKKSVFDDFRISCDDSQLLKQSPQEIVHTSSSTPTSKTYAPTLVDTFRKGVKRDTTLYPTLKRPDKWDSFKREFYAIARSHNVHDILDPAYKPSSNDEKELFEEQQAFMYAVLIKNLTLDQGQKLVRSHVGDAQKIFSLLSQEMEKSTRADLDADDLMNYVITSRVNDGTWKGSLETYIIHWQEQVRKLHTLGTRKFQESTLKKFLQNALCVVDEFESVTITEDMTYIQQGQAKLTYAQYLEAVLAIAKRLDKKNQAHAIKPRRSPRNVYYHDQEDEEMEFYDAVSDTLNDLETPTYGINTTLYEMNAASHKPGSRLPGKAWHDLSLSGQRTWDTLNDEDKTNIIKQLSSQQGGFRNKSSGVRHPTKFIPQGKPHTPSPRGLQSQKSKGSALKNLHNAVRAFYLEHGEEEEPLETSEGISEDHEIDESDQLHAFFAKKSPKKVEPFNRVSKKPPGHIESLLTPPSDGANN